MASTDFRFGMTSKDYFKAVKHHGFKCDRQEIGKKIRVTISHPLLQDAKVFETATHGEANGPMIKWTAGCVKQLHQLEKDTQAPVTEPAPIHTPGTTIVPPAPAKEDVKKNAAEAIILWIAAGINDIGRESFTLSSLNPQARKQIGINADGDLVKEILEDLCKRNILSYEKMPVGKGKLYWSYRIHPQFLKGLSIIDVYGDKDIVMPPMPPYQLPEPEKPKPKPAPKPKQELATTGVKNKKDKPASFTDALLQQAATQKDVVNQLIDMYIRGQQFGQLASLVVQAQDADACEKILKRVYELAAAEGIGV